MVWCNIDVDGICLVVVLVVEYFGDFGYFVGCLFVWEFGCGDDNVVGRCDVWFWCCCVFYGWGCLILCKWLMGFLVIIECDWYLLFVLLLCCFY